MRSSSLGRLAACPGSAALPQAHTSSQWADDGTERHEWLARLVTTRDPDVAPADYYEAAIAILERIPEGASVEVPLSYEVDGRAVLTGHADVLAVLPDTVLLADWKGWEDVERAERNWQVRSYAAMAAAQHGKDRAIVMIVYVREGKAPWFDVAEMDGIELAAVLEDVLALETRIASERAKVTAGVMPDVAEGAWCKYCPAAHVCPAKTALIRQLVSGETAARVDGIGALTDEECAVAWEEVDRHMALLKRMKSALIARAAMAPIRLRNGNTLMKVRTQGNEKIDGDIAWKAIGALYGRDVADEAVERRASKKAIDAAIRKHLPPGEKLKDAQAAVYARIRAEGGSERPWKDDVAEVPPEAAKEVA